MTEQKNITLPYFIFGSIDVYLLLLAHQGNIEMERYESFPKQTFRNRINTLGSQGIMSTTIPVEHGTSKLISEVSVAYHTPWVNQLWQQLVSNYKKSAFFEFYAPEIEEMLFAKPTNLLAFSEQTMQWTCEQLGIGFPTQVTTSFNPQPVGTDTRNWFKCSKFPQLFHQPEYYQVFGDRFDFQPNLNILDLLFNTGPESYAYLQSCLPLKSTNTHPLV